MDNEIEIYTIPMDREQQSQFQDEQMFQQSVRDNRQRYREKFKLPEPTCEVHGAKAIHCQTSEVVSKYLDFDITKTWGYKWEEFTKKFKNYKLRFVRWFAYNIYCSHKSTYLYYSDFLHPESAKYQCTRCQRIFKFNEFKHGESEELFHRV